MAVVLPVRPTVAQTADDVIERGQDFAVHELVTAALSADGQTRFQTNRSTLLENGLHYRDENGEWQESRDLIEPFPEGAVARYGPNQAIFSPDMNAAAVFDIQMADGGRLRGGVRAIQLTDVATGRSEVLGTVKKSAPGELVPPDRIVYRDAFDGLKADVVLVWRHNQFLQDVILRQRPRLPEGWEPAGVRLEVVTELVECPDPELRSQWVGRAGEEPLEDHTVVDFGAMVVLMGHAFPLDGDNAWTLGGMTPSGPKTPVLKQFHELPDGRRFLVESVGWSEAEAQWANLGLTARLEPASEQAPSAIEPSPAGTVEGGQNSRLAATTSVVPTDAAASSPPLETQWRTWPESRPDSLEARPIELAQAPYEPQGYLVDANFITVSGGSPTTFLSGWTYYVKTSYYSGSSVTFQANCTIKFKNNAYLLLYGPVSFPGSGYEVVFTSRNDDRFGAKIQGVPGEAPSDGNPTMHMASVALWIYYVDFGTTVQGARIYWAQQGVRYDVNPGVYVTHHLKYSDFECCENAVYADLQSATLALTDVTKCSMLGPPLVCSGNCTISGSLTTPAECQVESVAWVNDWEQDTASGDENKNTQSECSFVLADNNRIVAAFWDSHLSAYGLGGYSLFFTGSGPIRSTGWSVSYDNGVVFHDQGALPPTPPASALEGDAGDPVMARDPTNGDIYLLLNPSRESGSWKGFRLWKSTDNGTSFSLVTTDVFGGSVDQCDKPMIAISSTGTIYVAGRSGPTDVMFTQSTDGGEHWSSNPDPLGSFSGAEIAVRNNGDPYVFFLHEESGVYTLQYRWLHSGEWQGSGATIPAHGTQGQPNDALFSTGRSGGGLPKRSNSAQADAGDIFGDYFVSNAYPRAAVNPVTGFIYVVFGDLPEADPPGQRKVDRGDIFVQEATVNDEDGSLTWLAGARRANQDSLQLPTDQWNPSIAISPDGNTLFIGYYSRQERPTDNDLIRAYGVKADISNGLGNATFEMFPISPTSFPPLFPGPIGYDLRLMSVADPSEMPASGERLVVVAKNENDNDALHFKVFHRYGQVLLNKSEADFPDKAAEIAALKSFLAPLWDEATLSHEQRDVILSAVTSITGQTLPLEVTPPCSRWLYDPVFPQEGMCLDVYARILPCPTPPPGEPQVPPQDCEQGAYEFKTAWDQIHFMADDYTWAAADANYFHFAWCDRSRSCSLSGGTRPDSNVRFARIRY